MSRSMTLAIERIADDRRFAERFRRDPERALRRYHLTSEQIDAIKLGDPASLARHGVDVTAFDAGKRHGWRPRWRKVVVGFAVTGAALGLVGSPASANDHCLKTCIRINGVRRARRSQGENAVRLGRVLVRRASVWTALRRAGSPRMAPGRFALRIALGRFAEDWGDGNGEVVDPFVLAGD